MRANKEKRLSYTEQAKVILKDMTLEEKVHLMSGNVDFTTMIDDFISGKAHYNHIPYGAGGSERHNLSPMLFCDGPRGVVCGSGKSTCFPVSMCRGAAFDVDLEERIGNAIGREIRAYGGNLFGGVCINLPYNPGWGRSQEVYGEDSFALGQMGSALVRGVQEEDVIACIKHFAFNSMEISRFKVSVDCERRTEREVYLGHFKDCIDAGAASVMSAYNLYKGIHCGHSDYLLRKVLKEEWDFDGFVMSDFLWGVKDTVEAANGGQDMEMCSTQFFGDKLVKAVEEGLVSEKRIDDSALRIIRTILAFEDAYKESGHTYDENILGCKEHVALALEAAQKGITLLQNDGYLPFNKAKTKKIAVFGKLADKPNIGDYGSSRVYPAYVVTPLEGIAAQVPEAEVVYYAGDDLKHAKVLAKEADAVVFVVGYNHDDEGEYVASQQTENYTLSKGGDRVSSLGLHQDEVALIKAVGPMNPCSAAVLIGGNMMMISEWKDCVSGILMAYYPGQEGGTAIGQILFGEINPSGKIPFVLPIEESDLPQVNWDTTNEYYDYYHGYAKLEKEGIKPLLPYGFGLSYTQFKYQDLVVTQNEVDVTATVCITNTGKVAGDEIAQMYIGWTHSTIDRPVKSLRGFARVTLKPGESKLVSITCPIEKFKYFDVHTNKFVLEEIKYDIYVGSSSDKEDLLVSTIALS